jgi:hypothetical protein
MGVSLHITLADGSAIEQLPICCRSKGIEILKGAAVYRHTGGSDDPPEIEKSLLIHLFSTEEFGVVAEITKKPVEFPECPVGAVQPSREPSCFERFWFDDDKSNFEERLLGLPSIKNFSHANKKQTIEGALTIFLSRKETWNMSSHDVTSWGWA